MKSVIAKFVAKVGKYAFATLLGYELNESFNGETPNQIVPKVETKKVVEVAPENAELSDVMLLLYIILVAISIGTFTYVSLKIRSVIAKKAVKDFKCELAEL